MTNNEFARTRAVFDGMENMGIRLDSNETNFLNRQLLHVMSRVQEVKYPDLIATSVFPVNTEGGTGLESISYVQLDMAGEMKLIASGADDLPEAGSKITEYPRQVGNYGISYGWTHFDLEKATRARVPLSARKAMAARRASEQKVDEVSFFGDSTNSNIKGLFSESLSSTSGLTGTWSTASAADILDDCLFVIQNVITATKGIFEPDTLALPPEQYAQIMTTPRSATTDTTIAEFILASTPIRRIVKSDRLRAMTSSTNSISSEDTMIAFPSNIEVMELVIPRPFQQLPVQQKGLQYMVPCLLDFAGMFLYHPKAVAFGKGL